MNTDDPTKRTSRLAQFLDVTERLLDEEEGYELDDTPSAEEDEVEDDDE